MIYFLITGKSIFVPSSRFVTGFIFLNIVRFLTIFMFIISFFCAKPFILIYYELDWSRTVIVCRRSKQRKVFVVVMKKFAYYLLQPDYFPNVFKLNALYHKKPPSYCLIGNRLRQRAIGGQREMTRSCEEQSPATTVECKDKVSPQWISFRNP